MPLYAPAAWARRAQAEDTKTVAELSARRHAPADRARDRRRVPDDHRARGASSRPTCARATSRRRISTRAPSSNSRHGSRLNALRAQQELSIDDGLVEVARLALYRAQEALGVLVVADGPVDAADEPAFDLPPDADAGSAADRCSAPT